METKAKLINETAARLSVTKKRAGEIVNVFMGMLSEGILEEGVAVLPGIGKLKVKERNARKGRNPRTGEELHIPAHEIVRLAPGRAIKRALKETAV